MQEMLELILDDWQPVQGVPNGQDFAFKHDWAVVTAGHVEIDSPGNVIDAVQLKRSGCLIGICLNLENLAALPVLIFGDGKCSVPHPVRYIGPGLLTMPDQHAQSTNIVSPEDVRRASRTLGALGPQHARLADLSVAIVGAGRGCVACVPKMRNLPDVLYELSAPAGCMRRGLPQTWDSLRAGSLFHLNALATSIAVETWLGWLDAMIPASYLVRCSWPAGGLPSFQSAAVGPGDECLFCNPASQI